VIEADKNLTEKEWTFDTETVKQMEENFKPFAEMKKKEAILAQDMVKAIEEAKVVMKKAFKVENKQELEDDKVYIEGKIEAIKKEARKIKTSGMKSREKPKRTIGWCSGKTLATSDFFLPIIITQILPMFSTFFQFFQ
jgi:tRNA uridine 5-carbamoylmethylation protein Kti12